MPRANRHSIPGQVWHLTHRCHKQQWLLKFSKDRLRWMHWLFKARQRFGLCVLNYMVTSNHVHLLVQDRGQNEISNSMQLIAGRTAQEFNKRKNRHGAFWEDRYHATAVQTDEHLARCMTYIDLNMVRAGAVSDPLAWRYCGYHELHRPPERKHKLDTSVLLRLFGQPDMDTLVATIQGHAAETLSAGNLQREGVWSESVMIGDEEYIRSQQERNKCRYPGLRVVPHGDSFVLRESPSCYSGVLACEMAYLTAYSKHRKQNKEYF